MMRLTVPVLLSAIAISVVALPATGFVPWQSADAPAAAPAQIQALSRVDTSAPGSLQWADLRLKAQSTLDQLTAREPLEAREAFNQFAASWQADKSELQARFPDHWQSVDKAMARATQRLAATKPELMLSKAAVLDVLSAMDAATAPPRSSTIASTIRTEERAQIIAASLKDGKTGGAATPGKD